MDILIEPFARWWDVVATPDFWALFGLLVVVVGTWECMRRRRRERERKLLLRKMQEEVDALFLSRTSRR